MSVFRRGGKGNYYIQFDYRGKTFVKSSRTTNKRVAERMEREWKANIHALEELGERERITLRQALDGDTKQRQFTNGSRYAFNNSNVLNDKFPTHLYIDEIQDWHLTKFKSEREKEGASAQTIKHNFQGIRNAVKWAKDNGYQVKNLEYPKLKLPKHRLRYLSLEEEKRLLAALDPKRDIPYRPNYSERPEDEKRKMQDNYDLVVILLDTGARYGEIANIQWEHINLEDRTISLWRPKVRNESMIYMTQRVFQILQRRFKCKCTPYVFANGNGEARGYASKGIRSAIKRAGLENFTIHDLRHTCASRLIQNGMSLYEVSQILGHVDVQTTQRYAHLERCDVSQRARDIMEAMNGSARAAEIQPAAVKGQ